MFANIELCEEKVCVFGHPSTVALIPFFLPQRKLVSDCFSNVSFFFPFETQKDAQRSEANEAEFWFNWLNRLGDVFLRSGVEKLLACGFSSSQTPHRPHNIQTLQWQCHCN